ncbi:hypothetical protein [Sphingosinicella sp. BN140058]|uniref:Mom family adenine methylcarbamoylation protein n=1 Tax=Sphingosinicella sp. BN140058 TaxID=1892855 RepID=UPI00101075EE|nr:hypothetical protein [Sphingosinicella sp. BN140058]QAY80129.1 hypothetical protein ETR14_26160 [Sphingosinicella sp. BN140058]
MITDRSQRWRDRRNKFVPASTVIDPSEYAVDVIDCGKMARPFVIEQHYSGSFPASRLSVGLFRNGAAGRSRLVGVATFSVPMNNAAIIKHTGLTSYNAGVELGRLVLLDEVAGNGETWFLSRAFRHLRQEKQGIISVLSYADPMRRVGSSGVILGGHCGQIYSVFGAAYRGRSRPKTETLTPDGQVFCERALSKIRNREQGEGYAIDELIRRGAERPAGEDGRAWIASLIDRGFFRKRRHPGNHVYVFPLTKAAKIADRPLAHLPYPVLDRSRVSDDVTALPLLLAA